MNNYSTNISGRLLLYTWADHAPRRDPIAFRVAHEHGEWPVSAAKERVTIILAAKFNVRIENERGEVVFEAHKGHVNWPEDVEQFWRECGE